MTANQSRIYGSRAVGYGASVLLSLMLSASTAIAHVGHDNEFKGDGSKVTQPLTVNAETATALGIKTEALAASADAAKLAVPNSSIVDADGQKLVYVQEGTSYKPIVIQTGTTQGDKIEVTEGNLAPGVMLVTQGATLLYSQALRGGTTTSPTPASAVASGTSANVTSESTPASGISPLLWVGIPAGFGVVGVIAFLGLNKSSDSNK
ncbi:hypothetical protein [Microcoleus sp. bin38.metabat.b11b12b14.051]|uniref:hypothetical protein n=1 Tax=Microcoleus sp. bin38.metabat.b11b12b14.051 TaxID=2742709 RepID=UPI0025EF725F|nr:hypothetical protein [Microcoleus sp. bin38.metabat.b11b12b14.051]